MKNKKIDPLKSLKNKLMNEISNNYNNDPDLINWVRAMAYNQPYNPELIMLIKKHTYHNRLAEWEYYEYDNQLFIEAGENNNIVLAKSDIDYVNEFYNWEEWGYTLAEWLDQWGLEYDPDTTDGTQYTPDNPDGYYLYVKYAFYQNPPLNSQPPNHYLSNGDNDLYNYEKKRFDDLASAKEYVDKYNSTPYPLRNKEHGRPEILIVNA